MNAAGSHIPVLVKMMLKTTGPVLELGSGFNSTPLLYQLCRDQGRPFYSYESDPKWAKMVGNITMFTEDFDKVQIENIHWGLAFIDHKPGLRRIIDIRRIANNAEYIVIHDSEPQTERDYKYSEIYPLFKYRYDYTKVRPNTTVLSNFHNI